MNVPEQVRRSKRWEDLSRAEKAAGVLLVPSVVVVGLVLMVIVGGSAIKWVSSGSAHPSEGAAFDATSDAADKSPAPNSSTTGSGGNETLPQPSAPAPTVASINPQAANILKDGTTLVTGLFAKGQAAVNSNWDSFYQNMLTQDYTSQITTYYNNASNLYTDASLQVPDAVGNWNYDINQVLTDVGEWAQAVEQQKDGSGSNSDVTAAQQTYQKDLVTAQADIQQL